MLSLRKINPVTSIGLLDLAAFSALGQIDVKRQSEKEGALYVLKHLLNDTPFELGYSATNKPFLKGRSEHISISHSHSRLAVICNTEANTGIDIELLRDKVKNIQHKFLSRQEIEFAQQDTEKLVALWAAKETLYKVYGLKEVDFKEHLFIEPFDGAVITGHIRMKQLNKTYRLANETLDDYKLVYVLHEL